MSFFKYDGIIFNYEDDNNGGVPFIFLHGLGGSIGQTMGVLKKTIGIRRISMDFRGHGETVMFGDATKFSFKQFSQDVVALADYLKLDTFILGGISTGAATALHISLNYPDRVNALILSRPAWEDKPQKDSIRQAFSTIQSILNDNSINDKKSAFMETPIYKEMNNQAKYAGSTLLSQFDYQYAKETSKKLVKLPNDAPNFDRNEWREIKVPTLILASKQDPIHPFEYGPLLNAFIDESVFKEITPKEVSGQQHNEDSYKNIIEFLKSYT